jgi:hypothetical protein
LILTPSGRTGMVFVRSRRISTTTCRDRLETPLVPTSLTRNSTIPVSGSARLRKAWWNDALSPWRSSCARASMKPKFQRPEVCQCGISNPRRLVQLRLLCTWLGNKLLSNWVDQSRCCAGKVVVGERPFFLSRPSFLFFSFITMFVDEIFSFYFEAQSAVLLRLLLALFCSAWAFSIFAFSIENHTFFRVVFSTTLFWDPPMGSLGSLRMFLTALCLISCAPFSF